MKYNVEQFVTNTAKEYNSSIIATYDNFDSAKIRYHQLLASFYNASDVLISVVKIVDEFGNPMDGFREVVDHTPEPEVEDGE